MKNICMSRVKKILKYLNAPNRRNCIYYNGFQWGSDRCKCNEKILDVCTGCDCGFFKTIVTPKK